MKPSPRQLEVLALLREGLTAEEVASALSIAPLTVKKLVVEVRHRLGALNSVHAVVVAIRRGYIGLNGVVVSDVVEEEAKVAGTAAIEGPFCYVCRHGVVALGKHQLTEGHRRNVRRTIVQLREELNEAH